MLRNTFACLVDESRECVIDWCATCTTWTRARASCSTTVAATRTCSTASPSSGTTPSSPLPCPMKWGWLHDFALDCFRFALEHEAFDAMTIVDSDQLGLRPGYVSSYSSTA